MGCQRVEDAVVCAVIQVPWLELTASVRNACGKGGKASAAMAPLLRRKPALGTGLLQLVRGGCMNVLPGWVARGPTNQDGDDPSLGVQDGERRAVGSEVS